MVALFNFYSMIVLNNIQFYNVIDDSIIFSSLPMISKVKTKSKSKSKSKIRSSDDNKALVVWGTNLSYTLSYPYYTKELRKMAELPRYQFGLLIGL